MPGCKRMDVCHALNVSELLPTKQQQAAAAVHIGMPKLENIYEKSFDLLKMWLTATAVKSFITVDCTAQNGLQQHKLRC